MTLLGVKCFNKRMNLKGVIDEKVGLETEVAEQFFRKKKKTTILTSYGCQFARFLSYKKINCEGLKAT